ncbi:MAG: HAMP domain-containing histidine kinase [Planctomycetaceae bacterium]|nr:HAMP domain-containing histidine kinase [Planctomycetaceae bacterium]
MSTALRTRTSLHLPITLSVVLIVLNTTLMVSWIVLLAQSTLWGTLVVGIVVFAMILAGLSFYMILMIKEVRLNQRQANFVDSVTHELKSPIATLKLYLQTLEMRELSAERRGEFYRTMSRELERLDHLITQLLEVGRLDAIGEEEDAEDLPLEPILRSCAAAACAYHQVEFDEIVEFDLKPAWVRSRGLVLELIFRNLLDNAIKYGGEPPRVQVQVTSGDRGHVSIRVIDNGAGVPPELRKRIFGLFFRGGTELTRRRKGTGLGLYIAHTLVRKLKGRISVHDRTDGPGSVFEVDLPGRTG